MPEVPLDLSSFTSYFPGLMVSTAALPNYEHGGKLHQLDTPITIAEKIKQLMQAVAAAAVGARTLPNCIQDHSIDESGARPGYLQNV